MNKNSLYIIMVLIVLAAAAILFKNEEEAAETAKDPMRAIDYSSLQSLGARTEGGAEWTMGRDGKRFTLTSERVASGRPVAANESIRHRLVGLLRDGRPGSSRPASGIDLAEWGLEPPEMVIRVVDGSGSHEIHVGKPDLDEEVYYRAKGGDTVFKASARSFGDFALEPQWLRDPRMTDMAPHLVTSLEVSEDGKVLYTLDRVGRRWFVKTSTGLVARADRSLADQLVVGLAGMEGTPGGTAMASGIVTDMKPLRVDVTDENGEKQGYEILRFDLDADKFVARRDDEPDTRHVSKKLRPFVEKRGEDLVDPVFTGFEGDEVSRLEIGGPGRDDTLALVQRSGRWSVEFSSDFSYRVEQGRMNAFREAFLTMHSRRHLKDVPEFRRAFRVKVDFGLAESTPPVILEVSAARSDGTRVATRSDESGAVELDASAAEILATPYWDVLARDVAAGNDRQIDFLQITERSGSDWILNQKESDGAKVWETADGRIVETAFLQGLLSKLAYLSVADYVGRPTDATRQALAKPLYRVTWRHPEGKWGANESNTGTTPLLKPVKTWTIVRRASDTHFECMISTFPDLVFLVEGSELNKITDALNGIRPR